MDPHFLVHDKMDKVGIVVAEDVKAGQRLHGRMLDGDTPFVITAADDIPLGHKIALVDIHKNDTVIEYGHDIGRAIADIGQGRHVHVHNLKTKRW